MLQKDLRLQQDFLLLGNPFLARDRRHILLLYAALVEREVEYLALSRDTSDADLKQRKEVTNGQQSVYVNQAPVRAALHGRLLILDGLEKAERNVLPTLNNLLENRELSLDDGGMLVSPQVFDEHSDLATNTNINLMKIHRVHPDFRVAALASDASTLDPPLRSRFQARVLHPLDPGEILHSLMAAPNRSINVECVQELVQMMVAMPQDISLGSMHDAVRYLEQHPNKVTTQAALNAYSITMASVDHLWMNDRDTSSSDDTSMSRKVSTDFIETKTTRAVQKMIRLAFQGGSRGVAIVGPKGCYKSALVRALAQQEGVNLALFSLYSDMMARDLLLTRGTDAKGNSLWRKTPLTKAVESGAWVVLDGVDKISSDALTSLSILLEHGVVDLPDGTRLRVDSGFRCVALAHPPAGKKKNWLSPEVLGMFHFIQCRPLPSNELREVLSKLYPLIEDGVLDTIIDFCDRLETTVASEVSNKGIEQESLTLSMRKLKHICKRIEKGDNNELAPTIENAMIIDLMPDWERRIVRKCMDECGIRATLQSAERQNFMTLIRSLKERCQRVPTNPILVPRPSFEENAGHAKVITDILIAHSVGEEALLIMGYQGVGKNRVVDFILSQLNCEREYLQLHRDTTVQSLLSSQSVENGRIVYHDSPLVRAAKHGRILVVDEADKAQLEVVALLKGLIEDRALALPDGRTLMYSTDGYGDKQQVGTVSVHPGFRIWALANPASYPFHGNDISGEMSDVFSCHIVPPLDPKSQRRILKRYGQGLSNKELNKIINIWQDLRVSHESGRLPYPFSVREAVSVTKHLHSFPSDGLETAFENVIAFDRLNAVMIKQLAGIFGEHGVSIAADTKSTSLHHRKTEGGISTPRTRASSPKHGKIDENNDPHVGGNTWAGGSGGSDTAGLGGRGGPYRLDSGHPVHQVSDEMKAQVSEEAHRKARQLARAGLQERLRELDMEEVEWERFNYIQERVSPQIQQLQVLLGDVRRRSEERSWMKRQLTGELDDQRLVDALAGEKDVFKRRGRTADAPENSFSEPMSVKLVVDISASMYRFNGYDGRLQTLLEATLMVMEALKDDDRFTLTIVGHNGDSPEILLLQPGMPQNPKTQLKILETMVAHTQYTFAGDNTVEAMEIAVSQASRGDLILVISDANLQRYRIDPNHINCQSQRNSISSCADWELGRRSHGAYESHF